MKNKSFLFGIVMMFSAVNGIWSQKVVQNNIYIKDVVIQPSEDNLVVKMMVDGSRATLKSNEMIILIPVIKTEDNVSTEELPPVFISGNNRHKADKRTRFFGKNNADDYSTALKKEEASTISYRQEIAYQAWMQEADLYVKQIIRGCAECTEPESWNIVGQRIQVDTKDPENTDVRFTVSYVAPETEAAKNRDYEGSAFLDFQTGKSVIIPEFRNNYEELNKIEYALNQLKEDDNATIKSISLTGFASPEGNSQTNNNLSASRAQALKIYLRRKYGYSDGLFNIEQGGEDWKGLKELILNSNLPDKGRILDIIDSTVSEDTKEQRLKAIPDTYRRLLNEYFPKLRRVDYILNYIVRPFSVEEGRVIVKSKPAQMSLNEMYLVANSYEKGSQEFKDIFDIAVRMYPKDIVANMNAAAIALEDGNTKIARQYLDNYRDDPASWNNLGVLYAMEGDMAKAEEFFLKAQQEGVKEASDNLDKMKKRASLF